MTESQRRALGTLDAELTVFVAIEESARIVRETDAANYALAQLYEALDQMDRVRSASRISQRGGD